MNTTEHNWYESIEQYNLGHLSAEQAARFEAAMQADEELAAAVRAHRTAWEMQELLAENLLRARIRERMAGQPDMPGTADTGWNRLTKYRKYGLPVLLLLGALAFFVFKKSGEQVPAVRQQPIQEMPAPENPPAPAAPANENPVPQTQKPVAGSKKQPDLRQLAMAGYRVPEGLSGIRGQDEGDNLSKATEAFFQKKYRQALGLLEPLPENDRQEALSLRAHAHFGAGDFQAAARDFAELEAGGIYRREAQWFGLLSRMAVPGADIDALKKELEAVRQTANHPYREAAEKLMQSAFSK